MVNEPQPLGSGDLPADLAERLAARQLEDADPEPDTPETVRDEVRRRQAQARADLFERSVPDQYRDASLDALPPPQRSAVARWVKSDDPSLFIVGPVGVGKTYTAYAALRALLARGRWVAGDTVHRLVAALRPGASSPLARWAVLADVFLFDDLGAERLTEWGLDELTDVVDARTAAHGKRQIVTTNVPYHDLAERYGDRLMSRLSGGAAVVKIEGEDRRKPLW